MSKADDNLLDLGYKKESEDRELIIYIYTKYILEDEVKYVLIISKKRKIIYHKNQIDNSCMGIEAKLLQAINQKCRELGWL